MLGWATSSCQREVAGSVAKSSAATRRNIEVRPIDCWDLQRGCRPALRTHAAQGLLRPRALLSVRQVLSRDAVGAPSAAALDAHATPVFAEGADRPIL